MISAKNILSSFSLMCSLYFQTAQTACVETSFENRTELNFEGGTGFGTETDVSANKNMFTKRKKIDSTLYE